MSSDLFILGSGGQARDIAEIARDLDYRPVFVVREEGDRAGCDRADDVVLESEVIDAPGNKFAIGIGDNRLRAQLADTLGADRQFPTLIHPDSSVGYSSRDALAATRGTIVFPGVRIMGRCSFGDFCSFNLNSTVSHDCRIADFATLSPGAHLAGNVHIGEGAWLGMGVVVNQGTDKAPRRIGAWATIGSGAAVVRDVPTQTTQVGVPARGVGQ